MKKITELDRKLNPITKTDKDNLPTIREILKMVGNTKAETADNARRIHRIIHLLQETTPDLILENDDWVFLQKEMERNATNLTAWMQGQILDVIESAEKVDSPKG